VLNRLRFDEAGLIAAVVQDVSSGAVLMVGYMNKESLERTLATGNVWFWSRSRKSLWMKGEASGNFLKLKEIRKDCDGDALLVMASPVGPTCHTGEVSCFHQRLDEKGTVPASTFGGSGIIEELFDVIEDRKANRPDGSYTTYLFEKGVDKIGKKIGEESAEVIIAAKNGDPEPLVGEVADLWYHTLVMMAATGISPSDVFRVLEERRK
jgi:phosphoribosyl-ATP pyrophosphohydrolase/phosphoribosyl-AMP cyclohydrolase